MRVRRGGRSRSGANASDRNLNHRSERGGGLD